MYFSFLENVQFVLAIIQILWFGEDVEVLAPESLRLQIQEKINKMHELYHKNLQN
jgi:predicted DNA-binding transcriptional regulator YafY